MSTPQQHRLIGQVIADRYRVVELLAEGGMGAVYIADHLTLHKQVALKIVHPEHAGNTELTARFEREAMATSRIDHPNVISAIDFGTLGDGTAYLAVQLVRGPSLTRVLTDEGNIPWQRAAAIASQIADALSEAHSHGIIHRDLKPDNVLLQSRDDGSEMVKVLDFGVAKFAPESKVPLSARTDVTQIGMVVGTPGYMAPEQTIGNPADERSDLYALGVILWESLTGEPLWTAPDLQALVEKQMTETPRLVRQAGADLDLPEVLESLVASLLARRAEERPADAASVREVLRECLADQSLAHRWRTGERPVPSRVPNSSETTLPLDTPSRQSRPSRTGGTPQRARPFDPTMPIQLHEASEVELDNAPKKTPTAQRPKPSVPPPPPPSMRSSRRLRSSRMAWLLAALLSAVIGAAAFLVVTGRIELRPAGDMADIAQAAEKAVSDLTDEEDEDTGSSDKEDQIGGETGLPAALAPAFDKLLHGATKDERAEGIDALLAPEHEAEVPAYVKHMALLQRGRTCEAKLEQVTVLDELSDVRALPVLRRLAGRSHVGCGKKKKEDCFACLRKPLAGLIKKLEAQRQ